MSRLAVGDHAQHGLECKSVHPGSMGDVCGALGMCVCLCGRTVASEPICKLQIKNTLPLLVKGIFSHKRCVMHEVLMTQSMLAAGRTS